MKKGKIALLLLIISIFWTVWSVYTYADENRSIYVGDLIQLKIESRDLSADELRDKFKDFEIVDISEISEGYLITIRSFEPGEKTIQLGDKEITIVVKSTLDEIQRDEIFEGDTSTQKAGFYIQWKYVFYGLVIVFLVTAGINIFMFLKKRKKKLSLSPYQKFINGLNTIPLDWDDYCVWLTLCFKDYIESKYFLRIRGKTSDEIIGGISSVSDLQRYLPVLGSWLKECDYYKFSGNAATEDKKLELMNRLKKLVTEIEETSKANAEAYAKKSKTVKRAKENKETINSKQINEPNGKKEIKGAEQEKEKREIKQTNEGEV